jgi:hypothetical protein
MKEMQVSEDAQLVHINLFSFDSALHVFILHACMVIKSAASSCVSSIAISFAIKLS